MAMPDLNDWKLDDVLALALSDVDEGQTVEKKASAAMDTSTGLAKRKSIDELSKQVCAFANAGGGFIVYGVNDPKKAAGGIDGGVPPKVVDQDVKDWVETIIATTLFPQALGPRVRFIPYGTPDGHGAVVVHVPGSSRRPHWVKEGSREIPYLRCGSLSVPMPLQTFRDIQNRSEGAEAEILDIRQWDRIFNDARPFELNINPSVRIVAGPVVTRWQLDVVVDWQQANFKGLPADVRKVGHGQITIAGAETLFPGRVTQCIKDRQGVMVHALSFPIIVDSPITVRLFTDATPPIERQFSLQELFKKPR
jgi:hypothetical protein